MFVQSTLFGLRRCAICRQWLPAESFRVNRARARRKERRSTLESYCRPCAAKYRHEHYLQNKARERAQNAVVFDRHVREHYAKLWAYLATHPCVDCGEADPVVLEFDHVDRSTKTKEISGMITMAWKRVQAEIEKCEVRCANCHRRRTAIQLGYYKYAPQPSPEG